MPNKRSIVGALCAITFALGGCAHQPKYDGDTGFIIKKEKELTFDLRLLPIVVYIDPELPVDCYAALVEAITEMNIIVGRTVFLMPRVPESPDTFDGFNGAGAVFVTQTRGDQSRGLTRHFIDATAMTIVNAIVWLPATGVYRADLQFALHELGHVLGLEHDEIRESLMYKELLGPGKTAVPQDLTVKDRALLRDTYGRK
jgi:hypothetical protein